MVDSPTTPDQTPEGLYWGAFYLSRILSSNLRCLGERLGVEIGPIRIARRGELEVYGRARVEGASLRIGFRLGGPEVPTAGALSLFVEAGKGRSKATYRSVVPPGAEEKETVVIVRRLLARAVRQPA
jgi:hypothetical protein